MAEPKPHILLDGFADNEEFQSRRRGRNPVIPPQDRTIHGNSLSQQYSGILDHFQNQRAQAAPPLTQDIGIYVEIVGAAGCELPLDSLDTSRDFKLRSCHKEDDQEVAVIFVPEARREAFQRKLEQYLDPGKDSKKGNPRNHNLIDSISEIKLADLRSFWTDDPALYPEDTQQLVWWELWLKKRPIDENPLQIADQLAERINAQLGNTSLNFFDSVVVLIKATAQQLERAPELIANLEELRRAKETPEVLIRSSATDQHQWVDDLNGRLQVDDAGMTAVTILDTGINYNHPLLGQVCGEQQAERWNPVWPCYDDYDPASPIAPYNDHGSRQAGLVSWSSESLPPYLHGH